MTLSPLLATVDYRDPLVWAVFIGWILSVVLHEFSHGLVAYLGGDYTIRERGGLTLNPFQYIDPVFSILIPAVIFFLGGVPLPGGVTYIRRDLIRNRAWQVAVSAAGPAMNFILFLALAIPFHPRIGWIDPYAHGVESTENSHLFLAGMAWIEMLSVLYNLVPVPPLDGFQIVSQFMDNETRQKFRAMGTTLFFLFFILIWQVPAIGQAFHGGVIHTMQFLGFDGQTIRYFGRAFIHAVFGHG